MPPSSLRAVLEWERFAPALPDARPVEFTLAPDAALGGDGFAIASGRTPARVTAPTARGLLYGAFALMDACRAAGGRFVALDTRQTPDFPLRMLWSWGRLNDTYLHCPYRALPSLLSPANIGQPESNPEIMRFVRHMASMRVNALTLTYDLHTGGLPSLNQHLYRPFYPALAAFGCFLREWGVDLYLYTSAVPEKDYRRVHGETDCPYDPCVRQFWSDYIEETCQALPDLGGMHIAGSMGGAAAGILYGCRCRYCQGRTPEEQIGEQIGLLAGLLGSRGKTLLYDLTTDGPVLLHREVEIPLAMAGKMPANAIFTFKNQFQDYEELRYPEHPLFSRLEELPPSGRPAVAAQMQLFGEMRGKGLILSNATDVWRDEISRLRALGSPAIVGVIETHPDDAHPAMAEWHAWGRLAWNADLPPSRDPLAEWTRMAYPAGVEAVLPDLLRGSYMAASNTIYAGGLQCAAHGMLCPSPQFLKYALNETWYRPGQPAPFGVMGVADEPMDLYPDWRKREILANPRMFLLTGAHELTPALYDRLMREKDAAVAQYRALLAQWLTAEPCFPPGDRRYLALRGMLERNVEDARRFRACLSLFWRYHMGALSESGIDAARTELLGPHAPCSINTCDESVALFLERLGHMVRGTPFDARFNNMEDLPQITQPGWEEGEVPT